MIQYSYFFYVTMYVIPELGYEEVIKITAQKNDRDDDLCTKFLISKRNFGLPYSIIIEFARVC